MMTVFRFKSKSILVFLCSFALLLLLILINYSNPLPVSTLYHDRHNQTKFTESSKIKWDIVESHLINGVEILSMFPSSNTDDIEGVVLLLHGCNRDGMDWFLYPEEKIIVNHILSLSLAAIAISSPKRTGSRCWNTKIPPHRNPDLEKVSNALNQLFKDKLSVMQTHYIHHANIEAGRKTKFNLPLYAIGASSGGSFIPILHHQIALDGAICQISASSLFRTMDQIPPTAFIYMVHDSHANERTVSSIIKDIKNKPLTQSTRVKDFACHPKPVTTEWLMNRVQNLSLSDAQKICDLLPLEDQTGFLLSDPRSIWSKIVNIEPICRLDIVTQLSIIEELNVAFARHEITSDFVEEALDFISLKDST